MHTRRFKHRIVLPFFCALALCLNPTSLLAASVVDLKVLVISTGTADEDQGLDLIDDLLDEVGVRYDVLDSSREILTAAQLHEGAHGFYNGIILTDAMLYFTGEGNYLNSGFTLEEWQILHTYERDFSVREAVISGFPASGPYYKNTYDLDYGMDIFSIEAGSRFNGIWQAPAGGTELFEYVNTANALPITDYAVAASPASDGLGPVVQPLLTDESTGKVLVSRLTYDDGREVLYSSITNAWYLVHSQILNYEFLNFATQGVFIGARKVYLAAHVDDLFLTSALWNPDTHMTDEEPGYRNTAEDIQNLVIEQQNLLASHPTLRTFKLDMVFNGGGAVVDQNLVSDADTWIRESRARSNYGQKPYGFFEKQSNSSERMLVHFPVKTAPTPANQALLKLQGPYSWVSRSGQVCRATAEWVEDEATWERAKLSDAWAAKGATYDKTSCVEFRLRSGRATIDVTGIVNTWIQNASPNYGLVIVGLNQRAGKIYTREYTQADKRPQLSVSFPEDPLTETVITNKDHFRFINHTLTHRDMYTSSGTSYEQAYAEIGDNLELWQLLDLPEYEENRSVLVTGKHSGLDDTNGNDGDPSQWTSYPEGMNVAFMAAAEDIGVRYLASDASRENQAREAYVPGFNILLLPRYPTSLFYNVSTPEELTDEYNYIFYERYLLEGQDPCAIPGAICQPRSYSEILQAEADTTLRHMLTYRSWPHYFHINNLRDYGFGATLQFDWLQAVMSLYEQHLALPVINESYHNIGQRAEARVAAQGVTLNGQLDLSTDTVTLTASSAAEIEMTGVQDGELYGGQRQSNIQVGTVPVTISLDRALDQ